MKKKSLITLSIIFILIALIFVQSAYQIDAKGELNNDPYETYILGLEGELNESPLAYEAVNVINPNLVNPQDIAIFNNVLYYCEKGTATAKDGYIGLYDLTTKTYRKIGKDIISGASGVAIGSDGAIYCADNEAKEVYKFSPDGELLKTFKRPTEALFGESSQFIPTKVAVDRRGNIYITSEGNANGIIQLNADGEFVGYFGPNTINVTLSLLLKRLMLPKEDRDTYASLSPRVTTNLAIDSKNIVYTIIEGEGGISLKKYNVNGTNILNKTNFFSTTYQDLTVDDQGFIYTVDKSERGTIQVMDETGSLLFTFGSTKTRSMTLGEFDKAMGIAVDAVGNIWVLDAAGKNIQVFRRTEFAETVFAAIKAYNEGRYDDAIYYYNEILSKNSSFVNAYIGLGKIAQRNEDYDLAAYYFKIANYKAGFSEVFWEQRDNWLGKNLFWLLIIVVLLILLKVFKVFKRINKYLPSWFKNFQSKLKENRFLNELSYLFKVLRKPDYAYYDIKYYLSIRKRTAVILLGAFVLINIFGNYLVRGYLFKATSLQNVNLTMEILKWVLIIVGFTFANFLISTLQNGEGFFRDIFIGTIFSFAPVILFKLPIDLLSNALTFNEAYIYNILNIIIWAWSIMNVIIMLKEIHNFTIKELIINLLLTIVAIVVMILLFLVIYILANQLIQFIVNLIKEGAMRS